MFRLHYRAAAHVRVLCARGCARPLTPALPGRVTLFSTSRACAKQSGKKADKAAGRAAAAAVAEDAELSVTDDMEANSVATSPAKPLEEWTTLRQKLQQTATQSQPVEETEIEAEAATEAATETETETPQTRSAKQAKSTKSKSKRHSKRVDFTSIWPGTLALQPLEVETSEVPQLSYGLDRVLFNEGVYKMQDRRTLVYNFDPYLASIMPVEEFDYDALKEYVTSSKDTKLRDLAKKADKKYTGSTSSMTSILSHFHYLLSEWRKPNFSHLSRSWEPESDNFTVLTRGPAATFLKYSDGVYSIDSDKQFDNDSILSMLGKSMEKLLTLPKEEFEKYKKTRSHQLTEEEKNADEAYHYTTMGDFLMRSQLDAQDKRLPGTGVFDLKTRAVVTVRMDVQGHAKGSSYEIRKQFGEWESFEREYYDLIRSAFLKYSLQVRMGRMDGIFVAYHNTQRIFGFQYIPLSDMDHAIHGQSDTRLGDEEFKASLVMLNDLLDRATKRFPGQTLRLHVETRENKVPVMYFFVEPVTDTQMQSIQETNKAKVEQLKEEVHDLSLKEKEAEVAAAEEATTASEQEQKEDETETTEEEDADQNEVAWQDVMERVNEAVESESTGVRSVRDAVQDALTQSGLLEGKTEAESEKHVSQLVSALTAHSQESRELAAAPASDESTESTESSETAAATPLKDLILRVTKGIDENTHNLNEFQRMFARLAEKPVEKSVEAAEEAATEESTPAESKPPRELLGLYVTVRNKVNKKYVSSPQDFKPQDHWEIQYAVKEIVPERAQRIYNQIQGRRRKILDTDAATRSAQWQHMFKGNLVNFSRKGAEHSAARTKQEEATGIRVAWSKDGLEEEETPSPPPPSSSSGGSS